MGSPSSLSTSNDTMSEPKEYFSSLDQINVDFERHGVVTRRQLAKFTLQNYPSWAVLMFVFEVRISDEYKPRVSIQRYRKIGGGWRKHSSINLDISSIISAGEFLIEAGFAPANHGDSSGITPRDLRSPNSCPRVSRS